VADGRNSDEMPKLVLTRTFAAPRALVFKAWTEPKQMARWWGPKGFTNPVCEMDVRPGGDIRINMRAPDGVEYPMTGFFREVVPPERLVFVCHAHPDEEGNPRLEVVNTVTFAERAGKTTLTVQAVVVRARPGSETAIGGMETGWTQSLDRLADLVVRR
jgi:uncharacterized protein YndB with AHSA1/START domain